MEFSEHVLILQTGKFKEADLWVRFLSPTRGILSAFAFGGSRSRRRFVGCLDTFNDVHVRINSTARGAYLALQEGVLVQGVDRLRTDWSRYGLATNCVRFLQAFDVGPEGAGKAHFLLKNTLALLESAEEIPKLFPLFFRARLAFDQGYALDVRTCAFCGKNLHGQDATLLLRDGVLSCRACSAHHDGQRMALGAESLCVLDTIHSLSPTEWTALQLANRESAECAKAIDGFIQYHVGLAWNNGRFSRV